MIEPSKDRKEKTMNIEIANRLVQMRKAHGYSQEELAAQLGISRQAVSKWERAESSPDTDNLIMLSKLYGVSLDSLLATEDEIPRPEPEDEPAYEDEGVKTGTGAHISFSKGINVTDDDGSRVHIGWDGIRVSDPAKGDKVVIVSPKEFDDEERDPDEDFINDYINDIKVEGDGVSFTRGGERVHEKWNSTGESGKRRFVHKAQRKNGKWRTTVIDEDGHKVVIDTNKEPEVDSRGNVHNRVSVGGFPYAVLVTGVFLLLGFLKNWWHPAWILFLTIPVYSSVVSAIRTKKVNWLDIAVPVVVVGVYVALGMIYNLWHPLWMILLILPAYYGFTSIGGRDRGRLTKVWTILVCIAYLATGFIFGETAWKVNWLLFFTIPMVHSIQRSIEVKAGVRWLSRFPWELLIVAGYLFVGLMYGIWHPTWVAFLFIPVIRWLISSIVKSRTPASDGGVFVECDDDDDDDDE